MAKNYPNLPGVNIEMKDGQLNTTVSRSANSILIIAEAKTDRKVPEEPMYVSNQQDLYENFGGFFHQGQLNPIAAQWLTAYKAGVTNIYLMALNGESEKKQFVDLYKKLFDKVVDLSISHVVLDGLYADKEVEGLTLDDFKEEDGEEKDTSDIHLPIYNVYKSDTVYTQGLADSETLTIKFKNNTDSFILTIVPGAEISKINRDLQKSLETHTWNVNGDITQDADGYLILRLSEPATIEGTASLQFPDSDTTEIVGSPAVLLANYAETVSQEIGGTIAYIGTSNPKAYNLAGIKEHVDKLKAINTQISPYLQIVAGPEVGVTVPGSLRRQWVSGAVHYAVLVNSILPQYAPTNQPLLNANELRFGYSPRQLNELVGHKYVTFTIKNNQIRVVDAVTTAPDLAIGQDIIKSDFTRLSTLRIMNYMIARMRVALEPFIGAPNEFYNYNGMNTAIRSELDDAVERGIIQDATYNVRLGQTLDSAEVDLTILPQFELRTINTTIALSGPEAFARATE